MRLLVGIDDTDSSRGFCTTYLAYRIATDLRPEVQVLPYPRLVRLNPNIPFKTRGNAAVCLQLEAPDAKVAFDRVMAKVAEFSDVEGGANSGMILVEDPRVAHLFRPLYQEALSGLVNPHRVRRQLTELGVRHFELGNGMGLVGAAASLGFDERIDDYTYELIGYRRKEFWGTRRLIDSASVVEMDRKTFPNTFNNYDYQKKKILIAPHGPDPVFAGVRGVSPSYVVSAFGMLTYEEQLDGYMVYVSNQHTDAHLQRPLEWKAYSSGWIECDVEGVRVGEGGHTYITILSGGQRRLAAAYEPTGDLKRSVRLLRAGDRIRAFGGVRRGTSRHTEILNLEKIEVISLVERDRGLQKGIYIPSPRANRHLTKPLVRYRISC